MTELTWATPADRDAVLPLVEAYHRLEGFHGHSRDALENVLNDLLENQDRGRVLVAREDGEIVGYALVIRRPSFEWAADIAVLDEIFVQGKARDQGLGRQMIAFVEDYASSEGLPTIMLEVSNRNVAAHEFYRSVGFFTHGPGDFRTEGPRAALRHPLRSIR